MALVKCPECGREISTLATTCPGCGAPVEASLRHADEKAESVVQNSESADNTLRGKRTDDPPLDEHGSPTAPQSFKKHDFRLALVIGLLALAFLAGIYVFKGSGGAGSNVSAEETAYPMHALDKFCAWSELAEFCYSGRVIAIVCHADPHDCDAPSVYSVPDQGPYEQGRPYEQETHAAATRQYLGLRIGYLMTVYGYGNAVGCKVLSGVENADLMSQMLWTGTFGDPRPVGGGPLEAIAFADQSRLRTDIATALRNGKKDEETPPSTCQYWHDHPEQVTAVQEVERNSMSWALMPR